MEQDIVYGGCFLAFLSLYFDWMDLFYLLGMAYSSQELGRSSRVIEFLGQG